MPVGLSRVTLPDFGDPPRPRVDTAATYASRTAKLYTAAATEWVAVYGDREHCANLVHFCGFDPRFEEALLVVGPAGRRTLVVGNECFDYAAVVAPGVEIRLCQSFSLMGQDRSRAGRLSSVLRETGIGTSDLVGVVGWKYLEPSETDDTAEPSFVAKFIVDEIRAASGRPPVDVTSVVMHPGNGLRVENSAARLAAIEWAAVRSSAAVRRVVCGTEPGMTEEAALGLIEYRGEPLSVHPMFASGTERLVGLRSPTERVLQAGDAVTTAIGLWGGLTCRAGILTDTVDEQFVRDIVTPYFAAIASWYGALQIGQTGASVHAAVARAFAGSGIGSMLNPGHLIGYEEWVHSPIAADSVVPLRSGMALQSDIIPAPLPPGRALNCEDTVALADEALRSELADSWPDAWSRIRSRRDFMAEKLGIRLAAEVLPLSNTPGYLAPFWLLDDLVCRIA